MTNKIPFSFKIMFDLVMSGIFWLIAGIFSLIENHYQTGKYNPVILIASILLVVFKLLAVFLHYRDGDEMSEEHYKTIRANAYSAVVKLAVCNVIIVSLFRFTGLPLTYDWFAWILNLIGTLELISGIQFFIYEKKGEY